MEPMQADLLDRARAVVYRCVAIELCRSNRVGTLGRTHADERPVEERAAAGGASGGNSDFPQNVALMIFSIVSSVSIVAWWVCAQ